MSEKPEPGPKRVTPAGADDRHQAQPGAEDPFTVTSDVEIPEYQPLEVPYSEWETHRSRELLEANGVDNTEAGWRQATQHSSGLVRETAYYLLTRRPEKSDEELFRRGLEDRDESVQALSAYGLCRLGDESAVPLLQKLSRLDVGAHTAAARAAGILAGMGDPSGFSTIVKAMNSDLSYARLFAIKNSVAFVPLHGRTYEAGEPIDIWRLYRQALRDELVQVRSTAKLQLVELGTPEALALISP